MLLKSKISEIVPLSTEWHQSRLGKFTASDAHCLISDGKGLRTYLYNKLGEWLSGKPSKENFTNDAILHGVENEVHALSYFQKTKKVFRIIVNQHIILDECCTATPDGLALMDEDFVFDSTGTKMNCECIEVKCPPTFNNFFELYECESWQQLKKYSPKYHYQCLFQLMCTGVSINNFIAFHPDMPEHCRMRHIIYNVFDDTELRKDFGVLRERVAFAKNEFQKLKNKYNGN